MNTQIEYKVREVPRYIVTRYETECPPADGNFANPPKGSSSQHGEFGNFEMAYAVGYALAQAEHERLGYPPGDMRICYPEPGPASPSPKAPYGDLSAGDFLQALGDDAQKWADAFCEQFPDVPNDLMIGWFANAIEHSGDVRRGRLMRDPEAFTDHVETLMWQRRFWRELHEPRPDGRLCEPAIQTAAGASSGEIGRAA